MPIELRKLSFASLDEVAADAENRLTKGYDKAGNWDLAQVAGHVAEWMRFPIEGFPKPPIFIKPMLWLMKVTAGRRCWQRFWPKVSPGGDNVGGPAPGEMRPKRSRSCERLSRREDAHGRGPSIAVVRRDDERHGVQLRVKARGTELFDTEG